MNIKNINKKNYIRVFVYIIFIFLNIYNYNYAQNNIGFIENKGQWNKDDLFMLKSNGLNIWVSDNAIVFDQYKYIKNKILNTINKLGSVVQLNLLKCNNHCKIIKKFESKEYSNYFYGNDKSKWIKNVRKYSEIILQNIYKGIDLRFYFDNDSLRYDFIINPSANPNDIQFSISGSNNYQIINNELSIETSIGKIIQQKPVTYQIIDGIKTTINSKFKISDDKSIQFQLDNYNKNNHLIIDPIIFSTLIGGSDNDYAEAMAVDSLGCPIITGYTSSLNYPTTVGAYNEKFDAGQYIYSDIFVTKFSQDGKSLLFSTFIGSLVDDYAEGVAVDTSNNIFITGYTNKSKSFPITSGAYDTLHNGNYDAFLLKLNSSGDSLLFSTFIGGALDDFAQAIALDNAGNPCIIGYTSDTSDYPVTTNAFQKANKGGYDIFISKLNNTGTSLISSTLLGGINDDFPKGIFIDNLNYVYVTGMTRSINFPTTTNAIKSIYGDTVTSIPVGDGFICKLSPDGKSLSYSTFIGGSYLDACYGIVVDNEHNIYVTGSTESNDFPVTTNAYDTVYNSTNIYEGRGDIFITKLNSQGSSIVYSTYLGGISSDRGYSIVLDSAKNAVVCGVTGSKNFPVTNNAFNKIFSDTTEGTDAILAKIDSNGKKLLYSSYIGGKKGDIGKVLKYNKDNTYFITGTTESSDFPVTIETFNKTKSDTILNEIFLIKLTASNFEIYPNQDITICYGDTVRIGDSAIGGIGNYSYTWTPSTGLSATDIPEPLASPLTTTTYTVIVTDGSGNKISDNIIIKVLPKYFANIIGKSNVTRDSIEQYSSTKYDSTNYFWSVSGGTITTKNDSNYVNIRWTDSSFGIINLIIVNNAGCFDTTKLYVNIKKYADTSLINIIGSTTFCMGDSVILNAGAGYKSYYWNNGYTTQYDTIKSTGTYWFVAMTQSDSIVYSEIIKTYRMPLPAIPTISFINDTLKCLMDSMSYQWYFNWKIIPGAIKQFFIPDSDGIYYIKVFDKYGCSSESMISHVFLDVDDNLASNDFNIRINDNENILYIEINNIIPNGIEIVNILGQVIYKNQNNGNYIVNLNQYQKGIYFLKIYYRKKVFFKKIIL